MLQKSGLAVATFKKKKKIIMKLIQTINIHTTGIKLYI